MFRAKFSNTWTIYIFKIFLLSPTIAVNQLFLHFYTFGGGTKKHPVTRLGAAKQSTGAGLDLLLNRPSSPLLPSSRKWPMSAGGNPMVFRHFLLANLAAWQAGLIQKAALVSLDEGAKVKVERRQRFPSGMLHPGL